MLEQIYLHTDGGKKRFYLPRPLAEDLRAGRTGNLTKNAFVHRHAVDKAGNLLNPPAAGTAESPASPSQWDCGNGHLHGQAFIVVIRDLRVTDDAAMQTIDTALHSAGPDFCRQLVSDDRFSGMPF